MELLTLCVILLQLIVVAYGIAVFKRMESTDKNLKSTLQAIENFGEEIYQKTVMERNFAEEIRNNLWCIKKELQHLNKLVVMHHTVDGWDKELWQKEIENLKQE